jgi:hypothetical protein
MLGAHGALTFVGVEPIADAAPSAFVLVFFPVSQSPQRGFTAFCIFAVLNQGNSVSARTISRRSPLRRRVMPRIFAASWAFMLGARVFFEAAYSKKAGLGGCTKWDRLTLDGDVPVLVRDLLAVGVDSRSCPDIGVPYYRSLRHARVARGRVARDIGVTYHR